MKRRLDKCVSKNLKEARIWVETPKKTRKKIVKNTQFFDDSTRANEIPIHCLVNRSRALSHPKQKKHLTNCHYVQHNDTPEIIPLNSVCEETLLMSYHFISKSTQNPDTGMPNAGNWKSQQIPLTEFHDTIENNIQGLVEEQPSIKETPQLPLREYVHDTTERSLTWH